MEFQPPATIHENEMKGKSRRRIMPIWKFSDYNRVTEQLKNNLRHKNYLERVFLW